MNRKEAQRKLSLIDPNLIITGSRGDWYIDRRDTDYFDRRYSGAKTLAELLETAEENNQPDYFEWLESRKSKTNDPA